MYESMKMRRNSKEQRVSQALLQTIPSLERRLLASSEEEVSFVAGLVCSHIYSPCYAPSK